MSGKSLEIRNVSKIYRIGGLIGAVKIAAVDQVNLSLSLESSQAQVLSLVGESGSGKTTLARMVLHLVQPTHGQILLDGMNTGGHLNRAQM